MANNVASTPYSFTTAMATSFLKTGGAVPSTGPIGITTVKWLGFTAVGAELTITDGYGKTLLHLVAGKMDLANGSILANLYSVSQDFQVVSISSGTAYVSTEAVSATTGIVGGAITTNGTVVAAGTSQAQTAISIPGVTPTSVVAWSMATPPPATWQTGIQVTPVCGNGTVNIYLTNPTAGSITPAATIINIRLVQD